MTREQVITYALGRARAKQVVRRAHTQDKSLTACTANGTHPEIGSKQSPE
jgi:hypothetical protein